jgi:cellulose synthase/poly-beta-1,6-N-acetylglucosamine synthase-like glycosyltransferase
VNAASAVGDLGLWVLSLLVLLGAVPSLLTVYQFVLVAAHRWRDHLRDEDVSLTELPRVAVVVPAWNEEPVLRLSIDRMMAMDYPSDRLRVAIVDDASTDETPALMAAKQQEYPGRVVHLRRAQGGQGKAHTLNHGLRELLADDWAEAVLITDADVVFEPTCVRRLVRHLGDPKVGAVTAFIEEASEHPNWMNRFIGYEYAVAQAAGRRAQNVAGAQGCLAGGAQLHTRENIDALGGAIDTTTLAEDTVTTFLTQIDGRRVIFDGNAHCYAEEPSDVVGLWKQRLRWSRGNVQVARRFKNVFFRPSRRHSLGGLWIGLMWWATLLLPALMVCSCVALVVLWSFNKDHAHVVFTRLWIFNALAFIFTTTFAVIIEPRIGRRCWRQAVMFPGLLSLLIMVAVIAPRPMRSLLVHVLSSVGIGWNDTTKSYLALAAYIWVAVSMVAAWLIYRLDKTKRVGWLVAPLVYLVGYGPLLCAITFSAYIAEARGAAATWDKTEKTGKVSAG